MKITKEHRANFQIHTIPVSDSGMKHTESMTCKCKPTIALHNKTFIVDHNMVGNGPDDWTIHTKNFGSFTLEETQ